jgi:GntR family transcriptional repressor for pyruvate dehydrogenase complex
MTESTLLFSPVETKRAFEKVSTEIKKLIVRGELKAGDRLPSETEMARQFNVGRQTIREALRILELSGFICIQKGAGGGAVITHTVLNTLSNALIDVMRMEKVSINQLSTARMGIEKLVLEHAVQNCTEADIEALRQSISAARRIMERGLPAFDENNSFHMLLAKASGNRVFVIVAEVLMAVATDLMSRVRQASEISEISERVWREHEAILESIIEKDTAKAVKLMDAHLRLTYEQFGDILEQVFAEEWK